MIVVTGATGHLGRLAVAHLLERVAPRQLAVAVRDPAKAQDLSARGVSVRRADYARPETLAPAFEGAERLLFVSGSEVGQRVAQHAAVVEAARRAGVKLVAYTSVLKGDRSPMKLAGEHQATEAALRASGLDHVLLRNGWYFENYMGQLPQVLQHGGFVGSAGAGRIAAAARADFAAAAAAVIAGNPSKRVYELAGDAPFTMAELAAEVARQAGKPVGYADLPPEQYRAVLLGAGLPAPVAELFVDCDLQIAKGALEDASGDLRQLLGRPTTPLADAVRAGLAALR